MGLSAPPSSTLSRKLPLLVSVIFFAILGLIALSGSYARAENGYDFVRKWGSSGTGQGQFRYPKATAVDTSGYVYVADTDNNRIQKFSPTGAFITHWGKTDATSGSGDGEFNSPAGIIVNNGIVYVADRSNDRIQKFDTDGNFLGKFGSSGSANGKLFSPQGLAIDANGDIYIADYGNDRVQKFSPTGAYISKWGISGSGDGQLDGPYDVVVDTSGYVYAVEWFNYRVQKFSPTGTYVTKWGSNGTAEGQFKTPGGIAIDTGGYIYVADTYNHRIQKFTSSGQFITRWGSVDFFGADGKFNYPYDVAVDEAGNVYVTDTNSQRIQVFKPTPLYSFTPAPAAPKTTDAYDVMAKWGSPCNMGTNAGCTDPDGEGPLALGDGQFNGPRGTAVDKNGNTYVADSGNNRIQKFDANGNFVTKWGSTSGFSGSGNSQFNGPWDVDVDSSGNVYVADVYNHRIQKFLPSGSYVTQFGSSGSGDGQFFFPTGVAIGPNNEIYVVENGNHRIHKLNSNGTYATKWGSFGSGDGQFNFPWQADVDSSGNVYVADTYNHRIQWFAPNGAFLGKEGSFCNRATGEGCIDPDDNGPLSTGAFQFNLPVDVAIYEAGSAGNLSNSVAGLALTPQGGAADALDAKGALWLFTNDEDGIKFMREEQSAYWEDKRQEYYEELRENLKAKYEKMSPEEKRAYWQGLAKNIDKPSGIAVDKSDGSVKITDFWGKVMEFEFVPPWDVNYGQDVASGDFNGDGNTDIAVSATGCPQAAPDPPMGLASPLLRKGAGGDNRDYCTEVNYCASGECEYTNPDWSCDGCEIGTIADRNGDGNADAFVKSTDCSGEGSCINVYDGSPTGLSSTPSAEIPCGQGIFECDRICDECSIEVTDINKDGTKDALISNPNISKTAESAGSVHILLGDGIGGFNTTPYWTYDGNQTGAGCGSSLAIGDVNGDTWDDLAIGCSGYDNQYTDQGLVIVFPNFGGTLPDLPAHIYYGNNANAFLGASLKIADFNNDDYADISAGSPGCTMGQTGEGCISTYNGGPGGLPTDPDAILQCDGAGYGCGSILATGDIDADGYSDLFIGSDHCSESSPGQSCIGINKGSVGGIISSTPSLASVSNDAATKGIISGLSVGKTTIEPDLNVVIGMPNHNKAPDFEGKVFHYTVDDLANFTLQGEIGADTNTPDCSPLINGGVESIGAESASMTTGCRHPESLELFRYSLEPFPEEPQSISAKSLSRPASTSSAGWIPYTTQAVSIDFPPGDGIKTVYAQYVDHYGNTSPVSMVTVSVNTNVDTKAPTLAFGVGIKAASSWVRGTIGIPATASDNGSKVDRLRLLVDGKPKATVSYSTPTLAAAKTFSISTLNITTGLRTFTVEARDAAGNTTSISRKYNVDNTKPLTYAPSRLSVKRFGKVLIPYKVYDAISPTAYITIQIKNSSGKVVKTLVPGWKKKNTLYYFAYYAGLAKGTYTYNVLAKDLAGNLQQAVAKNYLKIW